MNFVQPIRSKEKIEEMKAFLKNQSLRNYTLFTLGIYSGLRISDLLKLNISDVTDSNGEIRTRITVKEKKTSKLKEFPFNLKSISALREYVATVPPNQIPLFASRKGEKAISRVQAYQVINDAARACGIEDSIGTHTLRKTFGYLLYKSGVNITRIQKLLNHSSPDITLAYIGITQDELDDIYMNM